MGARRSKEGGVERPNRRRFVVIGALAALATACGGTPRQGEADVTAAAASAPAAAPAPAPGPVAVVAPVAAPPATAPIAFHVTATGAMREFPGEPPVRWMASGPPGGPLYVEIEEVAGEQLDAAAIRVLVDARIANEQPQVFGAPTQVMLAGAARTALPVITGQSMARTLSCWVVVPAPGSGRSLLTRWGVGAGAAGGPDCAIAMANPSLRPIADSFGLD